VGEDLQSRLSSVGSLAEPARRALYLYVASEAEAVSREQAAEALHLPHHTVKFHLDRLVQEGLLSFEYRRLSGRTGPGAGRPAKLYRPSESEVAVSLPERRYDLLGSVLARAVDDAMRGGVPIDAAVRDAATQAGDRIGRDARNEAADLPCLERVSRALSGYGFQPDIDDGTLSMSNCPFHKMSQEHAGLICGMNLTLITAVVGALDCEGLNVQLDPAPGRCCVLVHERRDRSAVR
jgi:predicted ArsR family transcriptional regulator